MKTFECKFKTSLENKIAMIKVIRSVTQLGLRDSKNLVEERILPSLSIFEEFKIRLTELQLGRYFIASDKAIHEGGCFPRGCTLISYEEEVKKDYIDLTEVKEA